MIHLNTYEELLQDADDEQVRVHESADLNGDSTGEKRLDGLYIDGHIAGFTAEDHCREDLHSG